MMKIVPAVAAARNTASEVWPPSARNVSSGPYALDESPSAPRPTHASNAMSEILWRTPGSLTSFGCPKTKRRTRSRQDMDIRVTHAAARCKARVFRQIFTTSLHDRRAIIGAGERRFISILPRANGATVDSRDRPFAMNDVDVR